MAIVRDPFELVTPGDLGDELASFVRAMRVTEDIAAYSLRRSELAAMGIRIAELYGQDAERSAFDLDPEADAVAQLDAFDDELRAIERADATAQAEQWAAGWVH